MSAGRKESGVWSQEGAVRTITQLVLVVVLLLVLDGLRFAHVLPTGKIPGVGKPGTLFWFHRINRTIYSVQKNACTIGLFVERQ